jgi:uncharacterized membrane protein
MRSVLLWVSFLAVFVAATIVLTYGSSFVLFMWISGDNDPNVGNRAIEIAVPLAFVMSLVYLRFAIRRGFNSYLLASITILSAFFASLLLLPAIR